MCLIPEVPFRLDGDGGLLAYVDKVLSERGHCVLCVAEGAGQVRSTAFLTFLDTPRPCTGAMVCIFHWSVLNVPSSHLPSGVIALQQRPSIACKIPATGWR